VTRKALAFVVPALTLMAMAHTPDPKELDARRKALDTLLKEQWDFTMRTNPELASIVGDKRFNDRLTDFSQASIENEIKQAAEFLKRFEAIDSTGFPTQEQLNKELMVRQLRLRLEGARFKDWEMPVLQNSGIHIDAPQLVSMLSFESVKDYEDYISRLKQLPRAFQENTIQMRNGMRDGLMPPQFLLPRLPVNARTSRPPRSKIPPSLNPSPNSRPPFHPRIKSGLREAVLTAIKDLVVPAYQQFATFVKTEYVPKGRTHEGLWSLRMAWPATPIKSRLHHHEPHP